MGRDMTEHGCKPEAPGVSAMADQGRSLTYDEAKAAEAAFRGEPFNPAWSAKAAHVYGGILAAMAKQKTKTAAQSERDLEYVRS
ncbi:MAG TPA: hypothetical protein VFQ02_03755 [Nitrospira sp.]|nr:hypothetical protein [Nitrospira sp.]